MGVAVPEYFEYSVHNITQLGNSKEFRK